MTRQPSFQLHYRCTKCDRLVSKSSIYRHLSRQHNFREVQWYSTDYMMSIIRAYFVIPVQAYRIRDKSFMLLTGNNDRNEQQ